MTPHDDVKQSRATINALIEDDLAARVAGYLLESSPSVPEVFEAYGLPVLDENSVS